MHFQNNQEFQKLLEQMGPLVMELFPNQEFGHPMFRRGCRSPNRKNCSTDKKSAETYQIRVPLKIYDPSQVKISVNDKALMTISATNETERETDRNGMRKSINILEETIQLPDYLLSDLDAVEKAAEKDHDEEMQTSTSKDSAAPKKKLISKVTTKFEKGFLIITVPNKPEEKKPEEEERKEKKRVDSGPVDIEIEFV